MSIDAVVPLIGVVDRLTRDHTVLMWLVWMLLTTSLATLVNIAGSLRSFSLSPLLAIAGAPLTAVSLVFLTLLLQGVVPWTPRLLTLGVACGITLVLVAAPFLLPRHWRPHARAIPLVILIGRPLLIVAPALIVGVAGNVPVAWLAPIVGLLVISSEIVVARFVTGVLRGSSMARSTRDLRQFGSSAPVFVVPDDTFQFAAVTAGFFDATTVVFVREQVERSSNADDPQARRAAQHVFAHEAAHARGRHTLWRALAVAAAIALAPLAIAAVPVPALAGVIAIGLPLSAGAGLTLVFEASARRFARAAVPAAERDAALETS